MSEYLTGQENIEEDDKEFDFSDETNLSLEVNDSLSVPIPTKERKLHTQAYDKSISDLISKIDDNDVILNPKY